MQQPCVSVKSQHSMHISMPRRLQLAFPGDGPLSVTARSTVHVLTAHALYRIHSSRAACSCSVPFLLSHRTQDEPAYCGLASLAMVLNSLAIDPKRAWKGPWRWFHEQMLDCCQPLSQVLQTGIDLDQVLDNIETPAVLLAA